MSASPKEIYKGKEKLIISIDLGTTMSAVAYAHLIPESIPQVNVVNRWPGQKGPADSRVPSLVAYDGGRPIAFGANALEYTKAAGICLAKCFKPHLHPDSMKPPTFKTPPLPTTVTLERIYADFLGYLFDCAREFFMNYTPHGVKNWIRLGGQVTICLVTPNGWETSQQEFLRRACTRSGLLPGHHESRLFFVTEGEASVHYRLDHRQSAQWLHKEAVFAVVDAGGSTVDSTLYQCKETTPKLMLEEVRASECVQGGGVLVDRAAQDMLEGKLQCGQLKDDTYIRGYLAEFEKKTKREFDGTQASSIIKFGTGTITLTKEDVEKIFINVVQQIISSCTQLFGRRKVEHLLLVGGFGESPFLRRRLKATFENKGIKVVTFNDSTKKPAAEGAAIWYIKQLVVARAARSTFGIAIPRPFDAKNPDHLAREETSYKRDGVKTINGLFDTWVKKHSVIGEKLSRSFSFYRDYNTRSENLGTVSTRVYAYDGKNPPDWIFDQSGRLPPKMRHVFTLEADLSNLRKSLVPKEGSKGWRVHYNIEVYFGGTDLRARLTWKEGATLREGNVWLV